jgi:hypothetical protein
MKQLLASAACFVLIACGSSGTSGSASAPASAKAGTTSTETSLVQLVGPNQLNWDAGLIEMKYALEVTNNAADAITLRQIQIQTVGIEGPYYVPQSSYFFSEPVVAGSTRSIEFFAKAVSGGNRQKIDAQSPVSVRIVAYFEAPKGNFRETFITNLGQSFKRN